MLSIKKTLKYFSVVAAVLYVMAGCNIINPSEPTPTYVHIDSFAWNTAAERHGLSISHNITNVFVYYNDNPIGNFDLPCTFPVITQGDSGTLTVFPGVVLNGQNNFLAKYPFYQSYDLGLKTQPGKVVNVHPITAFNVYMSDTIISNFNTIVGFGLASGTTPIAQHVDVANSSDGTPFGQISLRTATNDTASEDSSRIQFPIPITSQSIIEFEYKNTKPFYMGLQSNVLGVISYKSYLVGLQPSDHWQKFYMTAGDFASQFTGSTYTLFIKTSLDPGDTAGQVQIDNIQYLHY